LPATFEPGIKDDDYYFFNLLNTHAPNAFAQSNYYWQAGSWVAVESVAGLHFMKLDVVNHALANNFELISKVFYEQYLIPQLLRLRLKKVAERVKQRLNTPLVYKPQLSVVIPGRVDDDTLYANVGGTIKVGGFSILNRHVERGEFNEEFRHFGYFAWNKLMEDVRMFWCKAFNNQETLLLITPFSARLFTVFAVNGVEQLGYVYTALSQKYSPILSSEVTLEGTNVFAHIITQHAEHQLLYKQRVGPFIDVIHLTKERGIGIKKKKHEIML